MESLPQFEQFKVHSDPHTAGMRWERWTTRFERLLLEAINVVKKASDSADQKKQLPTSIDWPYCFIMQAAKWKTFSKHNLETKVIKIRTVKLNLFSRPIFNRKKILSLKYLISEDADKNLAKIWTHLQQGSVILQQGVILMILILKLNYRLFKAVSQATLENWA